MWPGRYIPEFQEEVLPPTSLTKSEGSSETSALVSPRHISEVLNPNMHRVQVTSHYPYLDLLVVLAIPFKAYHL